MLRQVTHVTTTAAAAAAAATTTANNNTYIHTYIHKSFIEKMTERTNLTIREKHR